jgi:O-antigen/teichoic acid export membrane protein
MFDQGICSTTNFLAGVLVARSCSKSEYGMYVLGFTIIVTFQIFMRSLISVPFTVNSPRLRDKDRNEYFGSALVQELVLYAIAALIVAAVAAMMWIGWRNHHLTPVIMTLSLALFCLGLRDFIRLALLAQLRVWASLIMGLFANAATLGLLLWACAGKWVSTPAAYLILAGCSGLAAGGALLCIRKRISVVRGRIICDLATNWNCGKWTLAAVVTNTLGIRAMPWLVLLWCGNEAVASFGALMGIAGIVSPLVIGFAGYLMPKLSNDYKAKGPAAVLATGAAIVKTIAIASIAYVTAIALWGDWITGFIYTARYQGFAAVLGLLALGVGLEAATVPLKILLRVTNRPKTEFHGVAASLIAGLLLSMYLIPSFGIMGAALTVVAARLTTFLVDLMAVRYYRGLNYAPLEAT